MNVLTNRHRLKMSPSLRLSAVKLPNFFPLNHCNFNFHLYLAVAVTFYLVSTAFSHGPQLILNGHRKRPTLMKLRIIFQGFFVHLSLPKSKCVVFASEILYMKRLVMVLNGVFF